MTVGMQSANPFISFIPIPCSAAFHHLQSKTGWREGLRIKLQQFNKNKTLIKAITLHAEILLFRKLDFVHSRDAYYSCAGVDRLHVCVQHGNISVGLEEWKTCTHELLGGSILMPF